MGYREKGKTDTILNTHNPVITALIIKADGNLKLKLTRMNRPPPVIKNSLPSAEAHDLNSDTVSQR